ncbi:putative secreted calcium-binding protein [Planktothrix rubescens CCAP 1459/22]|uniref:Secreted calcium-binding protein n=1 Tax=Planktothrix rubescens CCAP 1459/22 TaxID=329571 RepID=A0A6J7ZSD7_PLARU|nr:putative secreted calcium-binding protein [Planktothrix rubescens NIVA-CYA 18]CAD5959737.1 Iron-regulated protein FrpC [Planktothrix rubescens NIVA-CYA 18]CAH2573596.1 Iron-regulated protein FrpC [Planktothrix rubescens]
MHGGFGGAVLYSLLIRDFKHNSNRIAIGADVIYGSPGNDLLFGGKDDDVLIGESGKNQIFGNLGSDLLFGGNDSDSLFGGQGIDLLAGGGGNDYVSGDLGDDFIAGIDVNSTTPGAGKIDTLVGGAGLDGFYLGSSDSSTYYAAGGLTDFAFISDFTVGQDYFAYKTNDVITFKDLTLSGYGTGAGIYVNKSGLEELIAFLPGVQANQLNLNTDFKPI